MQVAIKGFINETWGQENFYPAALNTVGSLSLARAFIGSANYVGSPDLSPIEDVKVEHFHSGIESRRLYRETWLSALAVAVWNAVETVFYIPIAAITSLLLDDTKFIDLAKKSIVQFHVNTIAAMIGFVGQFTPTYAGKIYALAIKLILKFEPSFFRICMDHYSKENQMLFAGIGKCFNTSAEEEAFTSAWDSTLNMVKTVKEQMIEIAKNLEG